MQPLSNDLRQRILDAVDNKEGSRRKLAARFKVNTSTITNCSDSAVRPAHTSLDPTAAASPPPSMATPSSGSVASSRRPPTPRSRRSGRRGASPAAG